MSSRLALVACAFSLCGCPGGRIPIQGEGALTYLRYREGQILRHIAKNGRYLEHVWLRTEDAVDRGTLAWPSARPALPLAANARRGFEGSSFEKAWLPTFVYERVTRSVGTDYTPGAVLGYVAIEPGEGRLPIYEFEHDRHLGQDARFDHLYDYEPSPREARALFHQIGIIAYSSWTNPALDPATAQAWRDEYDQLKVNEGLYFKTEAGGNDLLLVRMLATKYSFANKPWPSNDQKFPVLPVDGETPW